MPKDLGFLIAPYKVSDPKLGEILTELALQVKVMQAVQQESNKIIHWIPIHIELPVVTVTNDILLSRRTIVLPKDPLRETIGLYLRLRYLLITAKMPPTTTDFICDILQSQDRGVNFRSIFPDGNPNKAILDVDLSLKKYTLFSVDRLKELDMLRVDILQTDVDIEGVELLLGTQLVTD